MLSTVVCIALGVVLVGGFLAFTVKIICEKPEPKDGEAK